MPFCGVVGQRDRIARAVIAAKDGDGVGRAVVRDAEPRLLDRLAAFRDR
jgi:hypothetical protein